MSGFRKFEENGKNYCFSPEGFKMAVQEFLNAHKNSRYTLKSLFIEMGERVAMSHDSINAYYRKHNGPGSLQQIMDLGSFLNVDYHRLLKEVEEKKNIVKKETKEVNRTEDIQISVAREVECCEKAEMKLWSEKDAIKDVFIAFKRLLDHFYEYRVSIEEYEDQVDMIADSEENEGENLEKNELDEEDEEVIIKLQNNLTELLNKNDFRDDYVIKCVETLESHYIEISNELYSNIENLINKYLEYCRNSGSYTWNERGIVNKHLFIQEDDMDLEGYIYDKDFDNDEEEFDLFCHKEFGADGTDMIESHAAVALFYKQKFMAKFKKIVAGAVGLNQEAEG